MQLITCLLLWLLLSMTEVGANGPCPTASGGGGAGAYGRCVQCGDYDLGIPCTTMELLLDSTSDCTESSSIGCLTDAATDEDGLTTYIKRCATRDQCHTLWYLESSDQNVCRNFDESTPDVSCHFCCTTEGCNLGIIPAEDTLYNGHFGYQWGSQYLSRREGTDVDSRAGEPCGPCPDFSINNTNISLVTGYVGDTVTIGCNAPNTGAVTTLCLDTNQWSVTDLICQPAQSIIGQPLEVAGIQGPTFGTGSDPLNPVQNSGTLQDKLAAISTKLADLGTPQLFIFSDAFAAFVPGSAGQFTMMGSAHKGKLEVTNFGNDVGTLLVICMTPAVVAALNVSLPISIDLVILACVYERWSMTGEPRNDMPLSVTVTAQENVTHVPAKVGALLYDSLKVYQVLKTVSVPKGVSMTLPHTSGVVLWDDSASVKTTDNTSSNSSDTALYALLALLAIPILCLLGVAAFFLWKWHADNTVTQPFEVEPRYPKPNAGKYTPTQYYATPVSVDTPTLSPAVPRPYFYP